MTIWKATLILLAVAAPAWTQCASQPLFSPIEPINPGPVTAGEPFQFQTSILFTAQSGPLTTQVDSDEGITDISFEPPLASRVGKPGNVTFTITATATVPGPQDLQILVEVLCDGVPSGNPAQVNLRADVQPAIAPEFRCVTVNGVTTFVRNRGYAERIAELIIQCRGGTPTPAGEPVRGLDFSTELNREVTSRLLDGDFSEALLLIDDPVPANQRVCPNDDCEVLGNGAGIDYASPAAGVFNVYQGRQTAPKRVEWRNVPVDPPGADGVRTIRITNVRGNANLLGVSGGLIPSEISAFISATGPGNTSLIDGSEQIVGSIRDGLSFSTNADVTPECGPEEAASVCEADLFLRYDEGFASAFKQRINGTAQANPGEIPENSETGFFNPALVNGHNIGSAGEADQGTRLLARFKDVPPGASLRVSSSAIFCDRRISTNSARHVVGFDSSGRGGELSGESEWTSVLPDEEGNAVAVWEVTDADPSANDEIFFAVDVIYDTDAAAGRPGRGSPTVNGSFAPLSAVGLADDDAPRPRFFDDSTAEDIFTINSCATNLLWPYCTAASTASFAKALEGSAVLLDDIVLRCTGWPAGGPDPLVDVHVTLNTNVTSRSIGGGLNEALFMIGDPPPGEQVLGATAVGPGGEQTSSDIPNIFAGRWSSPNSISWHNLPLRPPPLGGTNTYRLTNIRANASQFGNRARRTPTEIRAIVSAAGLGIEPEILNSIVPGGLVQPGLNFSVPEAGSSQAGEGHAGLAGILRFEEGFGSAFQTRDDGVSFDDLFVSPAPLVIPGDRANTTSGFGNGLDWSLELPNGERLDTNRIGTTDSGTRLVARFSDVPSGGQIFVSGWNENAGPGNCARLVDSATGPPLPTTLQPNGFAPITLDPAGNGTAVWEICGNDPGVINAFEFRTDLVMPGALPGIGTIKVTPALAPVPDLKSYTEARPAFDASFGYWLVSDRGASRLAEGYLALVMGGTDGDIRDDHALFELGGGGLHPRGGESTSGDLIVNRAESELPIQFESTSTGYHSANVIMRSAIGQRLTGLDLSVQATTVSNGPGNPATTSWLTAVAATDSTPMTVVISADPTGFPPGTYSGSVIVTRSSGGPQTMIPVELVVPAPGPRVTGYGVGNAGSYASNVVSPGEAIVIFGSDNGPPALVTLQLADGLVSTEIGQTRVLFDGTPAPMIYAVNGQVSCFVPFGVDGQEFTEMEVEYQGVKSPPVRLAVLPAAPGLLTANQSGGGIGAILNQDNSFNSQVPEAAGNIVQLFGTGGGQTTPPAQDGMLSTGQGQFNLPVRVLIDGREVPAEFAGPAPGLVEGVFQVNVRIPPETRSGHIPVVVFFGELRTQPGVYIWVE